jgi:hypothetical protein
MAALPHPVLFLQIGSNNIQQQQHSRSCKQTLLPSAAVRRTEPTSIIGGTALLQPTPRKGPSANQPYEWL